MTTETEILLPIREVQLRPGIPVHLCTLATGNKRVNVCRAGTDLLLYLDGKTFAVSAEDLAHALLPAPEVPPAEADVPICSVCYEQPAVTKTNIGEICEACISGVKAEPEWKHRVSENCERLFQRAHGEAGR